MKRKEGKIVAGKVKKIKYNKDAYVPPFGVVRGAGPEGDRPLGKGPEKASGETENVPVVDFSAAEIRACMAQVHPDHDLTSSSQFHKSKEFRLFEAVLSDVKSSIEETEAVRGELQEKLTLAQGKLQELYSTMGTLSWLNEHIFTQSAKVNVDNIRGILPGCSGSYNKLMLRYNNLRSSENLEYHPDGVSSPRLKGVARRWPFVCKICSEPFQDEADLERHVASNCEYKGNEEFVKKYEARRNSRMSVKDPVASKPVSKVSKSVAKSKKKGK
jgi:hypothetical protein